MYPNPWDPLGEALLAYQKTGIAADLVVLSDFEVPVQMDAGKFFREPDQFPDLERAAIGLCTGLTLDIGAGAGCHVIALQEMGKDVIGIDISPQAVEVMKARGVKRAYCADIFNITPDLINAPDGVDTILMLMNGIGLVGNIKNLREFFIKTGSLLKPDGKLIFDSVDLRETCTASEIRSRESGGREYFGIVNYTFVYRGRRGGEFPWVFIDPDRLEEIANACGWVIESIFPDDGGHYLAVLLPPLIA